MESSLESAAVLGVDYRWTPRPGLVGVLDEVVEQPGPENRRLRRAAPGVDYRWTPEPGPVGVHGEVVERPEPEIRRLGQWPLSNGLLTPCLACSPPGV